MKDQRVLVTGCGGRVGAPLAIELAKSNEVHGIDRFNGTTRTNLEDAGVTFHEMFLGRDTLDPLPEQFDYVFHQAVTWEVNTPQEEREAYMVSVKGVVELMKKYHGAKRFVLGSTGGVCAPSEELVNEEELRRPDATPYH
jgi:nucleoside-diphosphate-sugar epimerase